MSNWITRLMMLAGVLALVSGCALWTPLTQPEVLAQALPPGTRVPPAWASATDPAAVTDDWLASFHDSGLETVVAEGIANNRDLVQAAARVEVARQTVVVVGSHLLPQVGAQIGLAGTLADKYAAASQDAFYGSNVEYLGVFWELDLWGRLRAQRAASEATFQATALEYAYLRQSLAATVAKSWYLTTELRQLLTLAQEAVQIYTQLVDLVQVRRAAGKVSNLDVAEARGNLAMAESTLNTVQGQYSEARRALELLLGRYPAAELAVAPAFAPVPPPVAAGLPSTLLTRRPDLVAAERQVLAAFRLGEAAQLALLPSFTFALDGGHLSDGVTSLLRVNPWLLHGTLGMSIPIYTGGRLTAQIAIATAQQAQAIARYGSAALRAFFEVEVALTNETLLAQRLQLEAQRLADNSEAVRIARLRYVAGSMDMLSVLQLQERQLESQATVIQLRNARLANRITLHLALGGSFDAAPATQMADTEQAE